MPFTFIKIIFSHEKKWWELIFLAKNSGNMKSGAMNRNPATANRNGERWGIRNS
jgi:hypothetical protein